MQTKIVRGHLSFWSFARVAALALVIGLLSFLILDGLLFLLAFLIVDLKWEGLSWFVRGSEVYPAILLEGLRLFPYLFSAILAIELLGYGLYLLVRRNRRGPKLRIQISEEMPRSTDTENGNA